MRIKPIRFLIIISAFILGILTLLYPFLVTIISNGNSNGIPQLSGMPLMMTLMLGVSLVVLIFEIQGQSFNTKMIALLGILVAVNAALRFIEVGIPGPGGFSPIFFLIILTGYIFGFRFGFLLGSLTLFVSALLTGGIGPWLPGQMITAGWIGLSAALLAILLNKFMHYNKIKPQKYADRLELAILIIFGIVWGFIYGLLLNLWSWPYISGLGSQIWAPGMSIGVVIKQYLSYYMLTSFIWDIGRGIGTAVMLLFFGIPTIRTLRRFKGRFTFKYTSTTPAETKMGSFRKNNLIASAGDTT